MAHPTDSKRCCRCGESKLASEFYKRSAASDGLNAACKPCLAEYRRRREAMTDADRAAEWNALATKASKVCTGCGVEKLRTDFRVARRSRDGMVARCKPCEAAWQRQHYLANRERRLQQSREWYAANAARRKVSQSAWYEANQERHYAKNRQWIEANRELIRDWHRARRATLRGVTVGEIDLDALWTGQCGICGDAIDPSLTWPHRMSMSVDHIIPLARGGTHEQSNLQWAHLVCNQTKGARLLE